MQRNGCSGNLLPRSALTALLLRIAAAYTCTLVGAKTHSSTPRLKMDDTPVAKQQPIGWDDPFTWTSHFNCSDGNPKHLNGIIYAFIPPNAKKVRGSIIVGGLLSRRWVTYPYLRQAAVAENLALIYATEGCTRDWSFMQESSYSNITSALNFFAEQTGFPELAKAPFFSLGCSTCGPWSNQFCALSHPDRCFGFGAFSDGYWICPDWAGDICKGNSTYNRIPALTIDGELETVKVSPTPGIAPLDPSWGLESQWRNARNIMKFYRKRGGLVTQFVESGLGHCTHSAASVQYTAAFIVAAAKARIPKEGYKLLTVDESSGWLSDMDIKAEGTNKPVDPAPYHSFSGDKNNAYWHFDEETAKLWQTLQASIRDPRKRQNITLTKPVASLAQQISEDGTFLKPLPLHSDSGNPVNVEVGMGHVRTAVDNRTLLIRPNCFDANNHEHKSLRGKDAAGYWDHTVNLWFTVAGNDAFQPVATPVGQRWTGPTYGSVAIDASMSGKTQTISFVLPKTAFVGAQLPLSATASSGLDVQYYVVSGPAQVLDNATLSILPLPVGGKSALPATVCAVQRGNNVYEKASPNCLTITVSTKAGVAPVRNQTTSSMWEPGYVISSTQLKLDDTDASSAVRSHSFRMGNFEGDGVRTSSCALDARGHTVYVGYSRQNSLENVTVAALGEGAVSHCSTDNYKNVRCTTAVWFKPVPTGVEASSSAVASARTGNALSAVTVYTPSTTDTQNATGPWAEVDRWFHNATSEVPDDTSKVTGFADALYFEHGIPPQIAISGDGTTTIVALPINTSSGSGATVRLFKYSGASTDSSTVDVLKFDRVHPRIVLRVDAKATIALIVHATQACTVNLKSLKSACQPFLQVAEADADGMGELRGQDIPPGPIWPEPPVAVSPTGQFAAIPTGGGTTVMKKSGDQSGQPLSKYWEIKPPSGSVATAAAFGDEFLVVGYSPAAVAVYDLSRKNISWTYSYPRRSAFAWATDAVSKIAVAGTMFSTSSLGQQAKQVPTGHVFSVSSGEPAATLNTWGSMTCTDIVSVPTGEVIASLAGMHQPAFVDDTSTDVYTWGVEARSVPSTSEFFLEPAKSTNLNISAAGHPRILLGKDDITALRTKVKSEPYSSWIEFLRNKTVPKTSHGSKHECLGYSCPGLARAFDLAALHILTEDSSACMTALGIVLSHLPPIPCEDRPVGNQPGCHKFDGYGSDGGHYQCSHLDGPAWSRRKIPLIYDFCADVWGSADPSNTTWVNQNLFWASLASSYAMGPACHPDGRMKFTEAGGGSQGGVNYCDSTNEPENFYGAVPAGLFACDGFDAPGSGSNRSSEIVANLFKHDVRFDPFNMSGNADAVGAIHGCNFSWCNEPGNDCPASSSRPAGCPWTTGIANIVQWTERQVGSGGGWDVQDTGDGSGEGRDPMWAFVGPAMLAARRLLGTDLREQVPGAVPALIGMFRATIGSVYQPDFGISGWGVDNIEERSADGEADLVRLYAFAAVENNSDLAAMRWVYDKTYPPSSPRNGNILSLLFHPADIIPRDPKEIWGNHWHDARIGFSMFRSGYSMNFSQDVVAATIARATPEWGYFLRSPTDTLKSDRTPDVNSIRIGGLGGVWLHGPGPVTRVTQTIHHSANPKNTSQVLGRALKAYSGLFPSEPANDSVIISGTCPPGREDKPPTVLPHGGYSVITGSCYNTSNHTRRFYTDYSGRSGAPAAFLVADSSANGRVWRQFLKCGYSVEGNQSGVVTVTNPDTGSSLRMQVLWPEPSSIQLALDTVTPYGSDHDFNGCQGTKHNPQPRPLVSWTDSSDNVGQWLVAMTLATKGSSHPAIASIGSGCCNQTVKIGDMTVTISGEDFVVLGEA